MTDLQGKIAIVTGGNTGIGKETVRGLAAAGAEVVLACRDLGKGEAARADLGALADRVAVRALDLADLASIRAFADRFLAERPRLDLLVNNAGVWTTRRQTTKDGFELTFGTNHLGPFMLTQLLLPLMKSSAPARIVNVSSALHYRGRIDWEDLEFTRRSFSGPTAYNQSKLANVLFTNALARRLEGTKVTVNAVRPGVVATELARDYPRLLVKLFHLFLLTPAEGAKTSLHVASAPELEGVTGRYFEKSREKTAARAARDEAAQERLWALSERLLAAHAAVAPAA
jgi:NAD(P)-dependent dehydrogenase (short-subunit alcohol dehydrogenase family)